MKLYFAGPDVFRPDALDWAAAMRALCREFGQQALIPLDNEATTAAAICAANCAMIREADAVIANLNPFRGLEPDSGTAFETGFAIALGKPVIAYLDERSTLAERLAVVRGPLRRVAGRLVDRDGWLVEDFGLPLNLMLATTAHIVTGDARAALQACLDAETGCNA